MYKNIVRAYLWCALVLSPICGGGRARAQPPAIALSFEVATIKRVDPTHSFDPMHHGAHLTSSGVSYWSVPLWLLIAYAYGIRQEQIVSPDWANIDRFDVEAKFPKGAHKEDAPRMLQGLLEDRFKLAFHIEKKELETYVLVVGKHGAKLQPYLPDPANPEVDAASKSGDGNVEKSNADPKVTKNRDGSSTIHGGTSGTQKVKFDQETWAMHWEISKITMEELAERLGICVGSGVHKVEDHTEIAGFYQVTYDCPLGTPRPKTGSDSDGTLPSDPQDVSSLTHSLDVLGLKLEKRKMLQDVYVIDHVEKPSAN